MKSDAPKMASRISDLLHKKDESVAPTASSEADDVISQLERLAVLKEKDILTDEEFAQQKTKILGG